MHVPGLKVVCVSDAYHAKGLLKSAVRYGNPVLIFEHKLLYGSKADRPPVVSISPRTRRRMNISSLSAKPRAKRPGATVTVVATHISLYRCLAAAEELSRLGIECEVVDPLTLSPLDAETIWESVRKTGRLVIVHEDTLTGGWGSGQSGPRRRRMPVLFGGARQTDRVPGHVPMPGPADPRAGWACRRSSDWYRRSRERARAGEQLRKTSTRRWGRPRRIRRFSSRRAGGDLVAVGDELVMVETDKANLPVESASSGTLLKIEAAPGEIMQVGDVVGYIGRPGEGGSRSTRRDRTRIGSREGGGWSRESEDRSQVRRGPGQGFRDPGRPLPERCWPHRLHDNSLKYSGARSIRHRR